MENLTLETKTQNCFNSTASDYCFSPRKESKSEYTPKFIGKHPWGIQTQTPLAYFKKLGRQSKFVAGRVSKFFPIIFQI